VRVTSDYAYADGGNPRDFMASYPKQMSESKSNQEMRKLLDDAAGIITGDRQRKYGDPTDNHSLAASFVNAYLQPLGGRALDGRDICNLMILVKLARDIHSRTRENMLDIIGYAANAYACHPEPAPVYDPDCPPSFGVT
jgi:hypothetical protein